MAATATASAPKTATKKLRVIGSPYTWFRLAMIIAMQASAATVPAAPEDGSACGAGRFIRTARALPPAHGSASKRSLAGSTQVRSAAVPASGLTHGQGFSPKNAGFSRRYSDCGSARSEIAASHVTLPVT